MALTKKQRYAVDRAKNQLQEQQLHGDIERAHVEADDILCQLLVELGLEDVVAEFDKIDKWYA